MNVNPLLQHINPNTFLHDYLKAAGVQDVERYLEPDVGCFDSPWDYPNMGEAVERVKKAFEKEEKIGLLVDQDFDGFASSALIYQFLSGNGVVPTVFFHENKSHGLRKNAVEDMVSQIIEAGIELMIVPDASTSDWEECRILKENGCDTIVLDHHLPTHDNPYAIIINPYLEEGMNKATSGTGVANCFYKAFLSSNGVEYSGENDDLVAFSLVSDICDLSQGFENRAYIVRGINNLSNSLLSLMYEKLGRQEPLSPKVISWQIAPPVNAITRGGNKEDMKVFFDALVGNIPAEEGLKVARRAHRIQTKTIKRIAEEVEPSLELEHKVVYGFADASDASYIGLAANKFVSKFGKPVFILREADSTTYSGSLRSPVSLSEVINASKLAKAQGHSSAAGIYIAKSKLPKLIAYLDKNLDLDVHPDINVTAILESKDITVELCKAIGENKILFGHGLDSPVFYCKQSFTKSQVQTFAKKTNTVKLTTNGVDFLKFQANDKDIANFSKPDFTIEMIVELSTNEWNGVVSPQAIIKDYEISENEDKDLTWESLF